MRVEIFLDELFLKIHFLQDQKIILAKRIDVGQTMSQEFLFFWLIHAANPVFYEVLPVDKIDIALSKEMESEAFYTPVFKFCEALHKTNALLQEVIPHQRELAGLSSWLIYNADNSHYLKDMHEYYRGKGIKIFYEDFSTGFDLVKRQFSQGQFFSPREMLDYVLQNRIGRILTINLYYFTKTLTVHSIHVSALLAFLGVEYISFDMDTYEVSHYGDISKAASHHPESRRLSVMPNICIWDRPMGNRNVSYFPLPLQGSSRQERNKALADDYGILVASHSRLENFSRPALVPVIYYLECCREEHLFNDFQMLYYALRNFVCLNDCGILKKMQQDMMISILHLNVMSLLKLEVLHGIRSDREILLFGDEGWKIACPEYYQGRYLPREEMRAMLGQGHSLRLLMNQNFSCFENNPVHMDAIRHGDHFLCFPSLANVAEFKSLKNLEYQNLDELNTKLEQVNPIHDDPHVSLALQSVWKDYRISLRESYDFVMADTEKTLDGTFMKRHRESMAEFQHRLAGYFRSETPRMKILVEYLFGQKSFPIPLEQCRFYQRDYVQRILRSC